MPEGFSNCTILGDGRIVPLVDAYAIVEAMKLEATDAPLPATILATPTLSPEQKPVIMVVDDSINVRRFLALTLEKSGYRVQQAKDGQEAMEKLQDGLAIAGVICDIEMPRLDGYGFLAQVRAQQRFRSLPIMMLTSRSGDKHRQMAFSLGASAYFSKPFQEQELLQTLKSFLDLP